MATHSDEELKKGNLKNNEWAASILLHDGVCMSAVKDAYLNGLDDGTAAAPMRRGGNMIVCAMCTRIRARIDGETARADSPKCDAGRR